MSGHRRPSINVFPHSYPPADKPARSETTTRYQSGVPPVRWGDVSRPSSSVMADASIFDPFRAAHAAAGDLGPPESAFDIRTQAYKRQENRGALAREAYWQHNFAHDPQTSGFRYHIKGISYAQNALVQTREAIDQRQDFGENFVGYDEYQSYKGHQHRINILKVKEAEMRYYKNEHRDEARLHGNENRDGAQDRSSRRG